MITAHMIMAFIFGAVIGSFLNVCIYRIPRKESIVSPGSHCPGCSHALGFWDLVPFVSQIALRAKCRYCGTKISFRYFFVELMTALLFVAMYARFMVYVYSPLSFAMSLVLSSMLVVITFIDLDHKIIPDKISYPGMITGLVFSLLVGGAPSLLSAVIGLFAGGGIIYLIVVLSKGGMGGGDVKLAAMLGAFLGWKLVLVNLFLSFFLGGIAATLLLLRKLKGRKDYIPFGPYLAIAAIITVLWGQKILQLYLR